MDKRTTKRVYLITASWFLLELGLLLANHFLFEITWLLQIAMMLPVIFLPQHLIYLRQKNEVAYTDTEHLLICVFAFVVSLIVGLPFYFI